MPEEAMRQYDFRDWLRSQMGFELTQIEDNGFALVANAELIIKGMRKADPSIAINQYKDFVNRAKPFLSFLRFGFKPKGVTDDDWPTYRPLCQALVAKRQMKQESLDLFEKADSPRDSESTQSTGSGTNA